MADAHSDAPENMILNPTETAITRQVKADGIIKTADEIEVMITGEIRKLQASKKRPDTTNVCQGLEKKHGLDKSVSELHLKYLLATGKLEAVKQRGGETLKIPDVSHLDTNDANISGPQPDAELSKQDNRSQAGETTAESDSRFRPVSNIMARSEIPPSDTHLVRALGDLAISLQKTNDLLQMERSTSRNLMEENISLKLRLKDLEISNAQLRADVKSRSETAQLRADGKSKSFEHATWESEMTEKRNLEIISLDESISSYHGEGKSKIGNDEAIPKGKTKTKDSLTTTRKEQDTMRGKTRETKTRRGNKEKNITKGSEKRNDSKAKQPRESERKLKITVIGDSQLRYLDGTRLTNNHHEVHVIADPGARIAKMKNQRRLEPDSDVIIVHAGTNNLKSATPVALSNEIIETLDDIKSNNPGAQVVFSSIFKRSDELHLNAKVIQTNKILKDKLLLQGYDLIDNDNILFTNLAKDGLHINQGGLRKFAGNISKYIRFCQ